MLPARLIGLWMCALGAIVDGVKEMSSLCGDIFCENNSNCRVTQTRFGNHVVTKHDCVCAAGSTGQYCEIKFAINIDGISSVDAKVTVSSKTHRAKGLNKMASLTSLAYKLQYWPIDRKERISCGIVPEVTSTEYVLEGLHAGTNYVVCVSAPDQDMCFENVFVNYPKNKNCVILKTNDVQNTNGGLTLAIVLASVFCVIIIMILVGLIVVWTRKRKVRFQCPRKCNLFDIIADTICSGKPGRRNRFHRSIGHMRLDPRNFETESFYAVHDDVVSGRISQNSHRAFIERTCFDLTTFRPPDTSRSVSNSDLADDETRQRLILWETL